MRAVLVGGALLALAGCAPRDDAAVDSAAAPRARRAVTVGEPAPPYSSTTLDGRPISIADQRGKVVLLNIWATWCHPCREEIPVLQSLQERYAARGFDVVGVSIDAAGEEETIRSFARGMGMTYPIWYDPDQRVSTTFLAIGVPASYLIDRDGVLRWRRLGLIRPTDSTLTTAIEFALGRASR
jgi:cytochrome c-type biogenesis protein